MRTRRANRTKSYAVQKYDFEGSSDEEEPQKRARADEDKDQNFAADDVQDDIGGDASNDEARSDVARSDVELEPAPAPAPGKAATPARRGVKRSKPAASTAPKSKAKGYLDISLATQDGSQAKGYAGQNDRSIRGQLLVSAWYGPEEDDIELAQALWDRWVDWPALPPKQSSNGHALPATGVWVQDFAARQDGLAAAWRHDTQTRASKEPSCQPLSAEEAAALYDMPQLAMPVLMGPTAGQLDISFERGFGFAVSQAGIPYEMDNNTDKEPEGWIVDTGGLVVSMDWAPRRRDQTTQLLALAVRPHSDQQFYNYEVESKKHDFQKYGTVQLWEFEGEKPMEESTLPTSQPPILRCTLCLDTGRARRVKWNPVTAYLAVLCGDGKIYIFNADRQDAAQFEKPSPLAILSLYNEENILATAMTWVSVNRIAAGYSDGSIALWSVSPLRMLSRTPVHHCQVIDIASGYPTMPLLIASTPVGGTIKLIDLGAPSYEVTEFQAPMINTQPGLLVYGDHMRGFFSLYPSARSLNTVLGFMHHANFPLFRTVFTGDCFPSCIAVGVTHPYLLMGLADGSLICLNPQTELFSGRFEPTYRMRLFQHEHRSKELFAEESPAAVRGASRILHGFPVEKNKNPKPEVKTAAKKGKASRKSAAADEEDEAEVSVSSGDPKRAAMQDIGTRVCAVAWNPNDGYGCWAAAAMASGLVRILDLGYSEPDN